MRTINLNLSSCIFIATLIICMQVNADTLEDEVTLESFTSLLSTWSEYKNRGYEEGIISLLSDDAVIELFSSRPGEHEGFIITKSQYKEIALSESKKDKTYTYVRQNLEIKISDDKKYAYSTSIVVETVAENGVTECSRSEEEIVATNSSSEMKVVFLRGTVLASC